MKTVAFVILCLLCIKTRASDVVLAAQNQDWTEVKRLVQANPSRVNEKAPTTQNTALHFAAIRGSLDTVEFLLKQGADPAAKNFQQYTPAHFAASQSHTEIVKKVLDAKPELLNTQSAGGMTLLMTACQKTNPALVSLLIQRKADVNVKNSYGGTALSLAARTRDAQIIQMLKSNGAK